MSQYKKERVSYQQPSQHYRNQIYYKQKLSDMNQNWRIRTTNRDMSYKYEALEIAHKWRGLTFNNTSPYRNGCVNQRKNYKQNEPTHKKHSLQKNEHKTAQLITSNEPINNWNNNWDSDNLFGWKNTQFIKY